MAGSQRKDRPGLSGFRSRRHPVALSAGSWVDTHFLNEQRFPLVVTPRIEGIDAVGWAKSYREETEEQLREHGAILYRGFGPTSPGEFRNFARALCPRLVDYHERAAPRIEVEEKVYTSTEFPSDQWIPLHHEMTYAREVPKKIFFFCQQPAPEGGRTPIADDRRCVPLIDDAIRRPFLEKKLLYVRNYGEGVDLPWQEVFQTDDRSRLEAYCEETAIEVEWRSGDRLRTRALRNATVTHPDSGETLWFNHAHVFHHSNLPPVVRESLLAEFAEDELPRNVFYGDGTPIASSVLDEIRQLYRRQAVYFDWQKGDLMLLDNYRAVHGREPFSGPRSILVAMAEPHANELPSRSEDGQSRP